MKKIIGTTFIVMACLLVGCNNLKTNGTLDTKYLTKMEGSGEHQTPIAYQASTLKDGLKALPFKVVAPHQFPFSTKGFQDIRIEDLKHDGKEIFVTLTAFSNKEDILKVEASNGKADFEFKTHDKGGAKGDYNGTDALRFKYKGIIYCITIALNSGKKDSDQVKTILIDLADQMID